MATRTAAAQTAAKKTEKTVTDTAESAARAAEQVGAETRKAAEQGAEKVREGLETATAFGQGNIEAMVASSQVAVKALETITSEVAAFSKKSFEDNMAAAKELSSCRDVSELVEKQAAFQRSAVESFVAETTRLNEIYANAAKEAFEPIGKRFGAAVEIVKDYRF